MSTESEPTVGAIEIRLFGELSIVREGRSMALPASKKTRALLAYLVTSQRTHTREKLCDFLWEGPEDPRAALRWSLAKIRPLIDEPGVTRLVADRERVGFEPRGATTDLLELRALLVEGLNAKPTRELEVAVDAVKGELLEGLDLPDCYQYSQWCRTEREAARRLNRAIRVELIERLQADPERALMHARLLVTSDPLDQWGHAVAIRVLGELGRSKAALQQYETCKQILSAQLNCKPSFDVEQARTGIGLRALSSSNRPSSSPAEPRLDSAPQPLNATAPLSAKPLQKKRLASPTSPLIGRESECRIIRDFIADEKTDGELLLVLGEPGVGKSRLLTELGALAQAKGGLVLSGRAFEAEMVRPYGVWIDALRTIDLEVDLPAPFADGFGVLIDNTLDRSRLFESVIQRLSQLPTSYALSVIVFDDIQWIDEASAALIHYAARALMGTRVRLACAARPGELGDNFAALRLVRTLTREGKVLQIGLSPLDAAHTAALARIAYPGVNVARVFEQSGGNPMYALEVARALDTGEGPTSSLDAMLQDRLDRLESTPKALVAWAATLGRGFSLDVLLAVTGFATGEFLRAIEELERRGFIRSTSGTPGASGHDFVHDLLRQAAYRAMSEPQRRIMHLAIARGLSKLPEAQSSLASDIAHHAAMGDDPQLAANFSLIAAERCLRMCAAREATELADRGLRYSARLEPGERARLDVDLLSVAIIADVGNKRTQVLEASMRNALIKAESAGFAAEVTRGLMALSYMHFDKGRYYEAELDSLRMSDAARSTSSSHTVLALAHAAQCLAMLERNMGKAEALAAEAKSLATKQKLEVMELNLAEGFILQYRGETELGIAMLERAHVLAEAQGIYWLGAVCLLRLATAELQRCRPALALQHCAKLREVVGRVGEASEGPFGEIVEAIAQRHLGRPGGALDIDGAFDVLYALDAQAYLGEAYCLAAESDLQAGDAASAQCRAERALKAAKKVERPTFIVWAYALLARAAVELGHRDEARSHVDSALPLLETEPYPAYHARTRIAAAAELLE